MGYELSEITIGLRLDKHLDEREDRDREAAERLRQEIADMIEADRDYRRIAEVVC